ncbi:MAG: hypothetical protein ACLFRN_12080 [Halothece sp.]
MANSTANIPELLETINPIYSYPKSFYLIRDKFRFIDLFAGIGGMRLSIINRTRM